MMSVLAACGSSAASRFDAPAPSVVAPTSTTVAASTSLSSMSAAPSSTTVARTPATSAATTTAATTTAATTTAATTTAPVTTSAEPALASAGDAGQLVVVTADRDGATTAALTAYEHLPDGWRRTFGPWPARVGTRGVAPAGGKWEGHGRTPSGVYGFEFFFGVAPDPGVRFPYRRVTSRSIVWDDDPASALYNTWVDLDRHAAGADPEPMYVTPAYDHGAVIAYNTARTPGLGSAIFLHVSTGAPTAGCVSLPVAQLVQILRWLDPARRPRIAIGVAD